MAILPASLVSLGGVLSFYLTSVSSASLEVNTTNGVIVGHLSASRPSVSEFLGIPYAQPPVGDLRFAPPEPYNPTGEVYHAANWVSASYPQSISLMLDSGRLTVVLTKLLSRHREYHLYLSTLLHS